MKEYFQQQIDTFPNITADDIDLLLVKNYHSSMPIQVGDKVLCAMLHDLKTDTKELIYLSEDELATYEKYYEFEDFQVPNGILPVLVEK